MSTSRAIFAIREMRSAVESGQLQLAAHWSCIFMAESHAAEVGRQIAESEDREPYDSRLDDEDEQVDE